MEQYVLYLVFKDILTDDINELGFKMSFNDINIKEHKAIGCYVRGGVISDYRELSSGRYINVNNRVTFRVNSGLSKDELLDGLKLLNNIKYKVERIGNRVYYLNSLNFKPENDRFVECEDSTGSCKVLITKVSLLSDVLFLGKNEQGYSQYAIDLTVNYKVLED